MAAWPAALAKSVGIAQKCIHFPALLARFSYSYAVRKDPRTSRSQPFPTTSKRRLNMADTTGAGAASLIDGTKIAKYTLFLFNVVCALTDFGSIFVFETLSICSFLPMTFSPKYLCWDEERSVMRSHRASKPSRPNTPDSSHTWSSCKLERVLTLQCMSV